MKQAHITYSGMDLDYRKANVLATSFANNDSDIAEPVMVAWNDMKASRMSPVVKGESLDTGWHQYGESHGGKLEVDVNGEYDFIFADSSQFDPYGPGNCQPSCRLTACDHAAILSSKSPSILSPLSAMC